MRTTGSCYGYKRGRGDSGKALSHELQIRVIYLGRSRLSRGGESGGRNLSPQCQASRHAGPGLGRVGFHSTLQRYMVMALYHDIARNSHIFCRSHDPTGRGIPNSEVLLLFTSFPIPTLNLSRKFRSFPLSSRTRCG